MYNMKYDIRIFEFIIVEYENMSKFLKIRYANIMPGYMRLSKDIKISRDSVFDICEYTEYHIRSFKVLFLTYSNIQNFIFEYRETD